MSKDLTVVDKLKRNVDNLKKQIVNSTKYEMKLIRDCKHAKSENDRKALLDKIRNVRHTLESYRQALDDLTYAFVKSRPMYGMKIVSRFGYKTTEGYLEDKQKGDMPSLSRMIDLIANHSMYIPSVYKYTYNEQGQRVIERHFGIIDKTGLYKPYIDAEPVFATGDPLKDVHDTRATAGIVSSGSRHR